MKIRTQFIIAMLLFSLILAIAAASAIITHQELGRVARQERIATDIAQGANELSYLANDYLMYREDQQLERWQSSFAAFSRLVAALDVDALEEKVLASNIRTNKDRLKAVFDSASSAPAHESRNGKPIIGIAFLRVSWSRLAIQSQVLMADASRLSLLLRQRVAWFSDVRTILLYIMVVLLGAFLLVSYRLTYRRILKSVAKLQAGAAVIGSGNLDFTVEDGKNDEMGELSQAFNRMSADLKAVTASKTDLMREMEERERVEKALAEHAAKLDAINKELESFSYSVSHDLRAPLRAIAGFSRMILKKEETRFDGETRRRFQVIMDNVEAMDRLIDDLLAFSRSGRLEMSRDDLNMEVLIQDIWQELLSIHPDRQMSLKVGEMSAAQGDQTLIRQVYANLLGNAAKFTRDRNPAVIEAGNCIKDDEIVYYVRDNGVGFDMKFQDKLFGVFQRLHGADQYEGTGIGLAIVQRIVNRHGGRVWAESQVGKGATFYFTLPTRPE